MSCNKSSTIFPYQYQMAPRTRFNLSLAWAVTIHKSQCKTFDRVHIDLANGAFAEGQVYVTLSRCKTLEEVTLEEAIRNEDIHLNNDVIQFYSNMRGE